MPKASVIMPVFNGDKYLKIAIESILNQTFCDFEFIIINDGSIDNTEKIILDFNDKRIRYVKNNMNMGIVYSLNKGIKIAQGEYIARMDADDICEKYRLEKQIKYLDAHKDIMVLGSAIKIFGKYSYEEIRRFNKDPEKLKVDLLFSSCLAHPSVMIRSVIFKEYEYNNEFCGVEDYELWWRISLKHKISNLDDVLLFYRVHENQITNNYTENDLNKLKTLLEMRLNDIGINIVESEINIFSDFLYDSNMLLNESNFNMVLNITKKINDINNIKHIFDKKYLGQNLFQVLYRKICYSNLNIALKKEMLKALCKAGFLGKSKSLFYEIFKKF